MSITKNMCFRRNKRHRCYNMITNKNEAKAITFNMEFKSRNLKSVKIKSVKIIVHAKKIIVGILAYIFVKIAVFKKYCLLIQ